MEICIKEEPQELSDEVTVPVTFIDVMSDFSLERHNSENGAQEDKLLVKLENDSEKEEDPLKILEDVKQDEEEEVEEKFHSEFIVKEEIIEDNKESGDDEAVDDKKNVVAAEEPSGEFVADTASEQVRCVCVDKIDCKCCTGLESQTMEKLFKCELCHKGFGKRNSLRLHMISHTRAKPHICKYCNEAYGHPTPLRKHIKKHHPQNATKKTFVCNVCNAEFSRAASLVSHSRSHALKPYRRDEMPHICDICNAGFDRYYHLKVHVDAHMKINRLKNSVEKWLDCSVCDIKLVDKSSLEQHMLMHIKMLPFDCTQCGKRFKTRHYLNQHVQRMHKK